VTDRQTDRRTENADHCYSCGRPNLSAVFPAARPCCSPRHVSPSTPVRSSFHYFSVLNGNCLKWWNRTSGRESGNRFCFGKLEFLFEFPIVTIGLSRLVSEIFTRDSRQTDNARLTIAGHHVVPGQLKCIATE